MILFFFLNSRRSLHRLPLYLQYTVHWYSLLLFQVSAVILLKKSVWSVCYVCVRIDKARFGCMEMSGYHPDTPGWSVSPVSELSSCMQSLHCQDRWPRCSDLCCISLSINYITILLIIIYYLLLYMTILLLIILHPHQIIRLQVGNKGNTGKDCILC